MELPGMKKRERPQRIFMDIVEEEKQRVGVTEKDTPERGLDEGRRSVVTTRKGTGRNK